MNQANIQITAVRLSNTINGKVSSLAGGHELPRVLTSLLRAIRQDCPVKKGYVVEFDGSQKRYKLTGFFRIGGRNKRSLRLFRKFLGDGGWKPIERGKLYRKLLGRRRPYDPYLIPDWLKESWVHDSLRVVEADVESALAFPLGGTEKLFLAMFMFGSKPPRSEWRAVLSLVMARIASVLFSGENTVLSRESHAFRLADKISEVLVPKSLGWDTVSHHERVRSVCEILFEHLRFKKQERFMGSTVASCHDMGKKNLNQDLRRLIRLLEARDKGKKRKMSDDDRADDEIYREHPQLGATEFYEKLREICGADSKLRHWTLPILCHHAGDGKIGRQKFNHGLLESVLEALGVDGDNAFQVLTNYRARYPNKRTILLATDCLRVADRIEDHAGWKHHRPASDATIAQAIRRVMSHGKHNKFNARVLITLSECQERIVDFYERLGRIRE